MQYRISLFVMIFSFIFVTPPAYSTDVSDADLEQRVENLSSAIEIRYTDEVQKHIRNYIKYNKKGTEVLLGRVSLYFPMFENVLAEHNLPIDLKYLAVVESGLKPTATSKVGASGLWQFMKPTGRMMGLKINNTIDERRDPLKSTKAAAEYLKYLQSKFGDWTLALAAYNCGPGNVRKAIRRSGGKTNFWEIRQFLPKETRNYVPKFIAVSYVMNYYYDHGIIPVIPDSSLLNTETATVYDKVLLRSVSEELGLDLAVIRRLNPAYIVNVIPANKEGRFQLTLPQNDMYNYVNRVERATLISNPYISKRNKVMEISKERELISLAEITIKDHMPINQSSLKTKVNFAMPIRRYKTTELKMRETLKDVASRVGLSLEALMELNMFSEENLPVVGSEIRIGTIE